MKNKERELDDSFSSGTYCAKCDEVHEEAVPCKKKEEEPEEIIIEEEEPGFWKRLLGGD